MMDFSQAMAYIGSFSRGGKPVRDLSRIGTLMEALGSPQDKLRFLHIAGTNGKGSVAEYLTNILTEAGFQTGTFTSPYIRHYRDRIRLNGRDIPEEAVCSACEILRQYASPEDGYSQFEITFAVAMLYFTWVQAELVVLETGVGGLLDCTNIVKNTLVCIFTRIGLDHMEILGNTVEEIAQQKAGIVKPGASLVCAPDSGDEIRHILYEYVREAGTYEFPICPSSDEEEAGSVFRLLECDEHHTMFYYEGHVYQTGMGFRYQVNNALAAIEAAQQLYRHNIAVTVEAIQRGLERTHLPGRMQVLSEQPLIVLDGAHNRDGIRIVADWIRSEYIEPVIGIVGMTHRDAAAFAASTLGQVFDAVLCVDGFAPNAMPAEELNFLFLDTISDFQDDSASLLAPCEAGTVPLSGALAEAKAWAKEHGGSIVICGSLYLVSWFLNNEG